MPRFVFTLNGNAWCLGQAPPGSLPDRAAWEELDRVGEWLPAIVPGDVRADLIRSGRLPDPYSGPPAHNEASQWVDHRCWWLIRDLALPGGPYERAHLILHGVDYVADVFLNGYHLARHEGMFSQQTYDVTGLLSGENRLAVRLVGSRRLPHNRSSLPEKVLNRVEALGTGLAARFPERRETVKCQMGFGWDFAPPAPSMGIWDDVFLVLTGSVFIHDITARSLLKDSGAVVSVEVEVNAREARPVRVRYRLEGETFSGRAEVVERRLLLQPGPNHAGAKLLVHGPRLWWPWDHGEPDLYRLTVEVLDGEQLLDSASELIGLRRVDLDGWTLRINGRCVYARGANWVPADLLPGRVTGSDYQALLALARDANMNMLRVWGGGLREKRAFYETCDRAGLLVWQEFPFACAFLTRYPRSPEFLALAESEARAIVRTLRNHPSLVIWCGGNEFSPRRNAPLVQALGRAAGEDPTRPFLPSSPWGGDSHHWKVWHEFEPPAAYQKDTTRFASEFGLQAPPDPTTLGRFIPEDEVWPPGPSWTYHGAGLAKLWRYARPFLPPGDTSLEAFVHASQQAQAHALQIAIEHYRRRKAEGCGGALVWQLNEPWPAISWAILDFYRQPKPAYATLQRAFSPVLVSAEYLLKRYQAGDAFCPTIWIINDRAEPLPDAVVEVILWDGTSQPRHTFTRTLDVPAGSAQVVGRFCWPIPPGSTWRLSCRLKQGDHVLTVNEYDLTAHDGLGPTWRQRAWSWMRHLFIPG